MTAALKKPLFLEKLNTALKPISSDKSVKWDYDNMYVRAPRAVAPYSLIYDVKVP